MKLNQIFIVLLAIICFSSCDDALDFDQQLEVDKAIIEDYIAAEGLVGQWTDSGVFYAFEDEGVGTAYPSLASTLEIIYTGSLLDGTVFDTSAGFPRNFQLFGVIRGWQDGMQEFKKDSKGTLLIPSGLGYGTRGSGAIIPGNAVLRFDVELLDFTE